MRDRDQSEDYAEALRTLSSPERFDMLKYLQEEGQTSLEELSNYMEAIGYDNISAPLIHQHLPIMEDYGVIDTEEDTITYRGDEVVEEIIKTLEEETE